MSWLQKFPLLEESCNKKHSSTELDSLTLKANDLEEKCSLKDNQIKALEEQLATAEKKLQELKGNIRVFCRVRPLLADESCSTEGKIFSYPTSMETSGRAIDLAQNGQKHSFTFDKVFTPEASQEEVFVEISQLVPSALDGYKVCIFACGQTGSGKTYTMMGRPGHLEEKGLIPRSLEQIFQTKQSQQPQGWKYEMFSLQNLQVSMLEIYNERIRDLISTTTRMENGTPGKQYTIKHDANGNTQVSDLKVVDVHSAKEVAFLLNQPANSRTQKLRHPYLQEHLKGGNATQKGTTSATWRWWEQQVHFGFKYFTAGNKTSGW
ncbi:hypothetical protein JHK86_027600 [Glycine max]|nr:hypothetical protein JHK86_027600 [Glycine max]